MIAYRAMLDVPRELVAKLAGLLRGERRRRGTRRNSRASAVTDHRHGEDLLVTSEDLRARPGLVPVAGIALVPVCGMVISGAMTATSLCGWRRRSRPQAARGLAREVDTLVRTVPVLAP